MKKNSNRFNILQLFMLIGLVSLLHAYKVSKPETAPMDSWRELGE
jgi:hypothetical protein